MERQNQRKILKVVVGCVCVLFTVIVAAASTIDIWLFELLDPGSFDSGKIPPPPDYRLDTSWAALPTMIDDADVSLPELPAIAQNSARADVFYIHPTTWVGSEWNGPIDSPTIIEATARGGTLIQASAFNACCAVYAPRYRQASGKAFLDPSRDGDMAIDVAYDDVLSAFKIFLQKNRGRPFILASHSQGTVLASRLLSEEIWPKESGRHLVVAYLIGGPITHENLGIDIPICRSPSAIGCLVAWNARGPRFDTNGLEYPEPMSNRICVNPLRWTTDGASLSSENQGAVFFDAEFPRILKGFASGECVDGMLLVREIGLPPRDTMSQILDWMMGPENYHPIEYQLFYVNLRQNALHRVEIFLLST